MAPKRVGPGKTALLKVLLVCSDTPMRQRLRGALQAQPGVRVLAAVGDGRLAVEQAVELGADVVVTAVAIPVMDGIEVTRAIVESKPGTAVVVVSRNESGAVIRQALRAGARGVLLWQSALAECRHAVRAVAGGKQYLGTGVAEKMLDSLKAPRSDLDAMKALTATERQILRLAADGKSNAEMAGTLNLSTRTVETYRARLMRKLALKDLPSLVKFAIRHGITVLE
jgi:DNA-binding NarL/FixJ family response regulator